MTTESIKKELISLVSTLFVDNGFDVDMIEYADLVDDLGMDSITFISLIVEIESSFNIEVPDDSLLIENFRTIDGAIRVISQQVNTKGNDMGEEYDDKA